MTLRKKMLDALKHSNSRNFQQMFVNIIKQEKEQNRHKIHTCLVNVAANASKE